MSWEQRWRDMVLAGAAVAAVGCGESSMYKGGAITPCCNASPDPCCPLLCPGMGGTDSSDYIACEETVKECAAKNGLTVGYGVDGSFVCKITPPPPADEDAGPIEDAPSDAGSMEAGAGPGDADAGSDAHE